MLIRSQDGKLLVPLGDHIIEIDNTMTRDERFAIYACKSGTSWEMGIYKNKEKAIKVLNMIQEACVTCESIKCASHGLSSMAFAYQYMFTTDIDSSIKKLEEYTNVIKEGFIFQMPADNEVVI